MNGRPARRLDHEAGSDAEERRVILRSDAEEKRVMLRSDAEEKRVMLRGDAEERREMLRSDAEERLQRRRSSNLSIRSRNLHTPLFLSLNESKRDG